MADLLADDIAVIQTAHQRSVVGGKTRVTGLAHVGVHVGALQERAVVERDGFAPDPQRANAVEAREKAGAARLERRDGVGLETRQRPGRCLERLEVAARDEPHQRVAVEEQVRDGAVLMRALLMTPIRSLPRQLAKFIARKLNVSAEEVSHRRSSVGRPIIRQGETAANPGQVTDFAPDLGRGTELKERQ